MLRELVYKYGGAGPRGRRFVAKRDLDILQVFAIIFAEPTTYLITS